MSTSDLTQPVKMNLTGELDFFLPDAHAAASQQIVQLINNNCTTIWISTYELTYTPLVEALESAAKNGAVIHILLDVSTYTQLSAEEKEELKALADIISANKGDITLTKAGDKSPEPNNIWHWKAMVVEAADKGQAYCWEGSTNFTYAGWDEGNSARLFRSDIWAEAFIQQFNANKNWALGEGKVEPQIE